MRNVTTASETVERTVEDGQALREVASVEVNGIDFILHHVNAITGRTPEQCEVLVAAVVASATVNLVVIKLLFWNEIAHDALMIPTGSLRRPRNSFGHVGTNQCLFPVDGGEDKLVRSASDGMQQPGGIRVNEIVNQRIHTVSPLKNKIAFLVRSWNLNGKSHEDAAVRLRLLNETAAPVTGKCDMSYRFGCF